MTDRPVGLPPVIDIIADPQVVTAAVAADIAIGSARPPRRLSRACAPSAKTFDARLAHISATAARRSSGRR